MGQEPFQQEIGQGTCQDPQELRLLIREWGLVSYQDLIHTFSTSALSSSREHGLGNMAQVCLVQAVDRVLQGLLGVFHPLSYLMGVRVSSIW